MTCHLTYNKLSISIFFVLVLSLLSCRKEVRLQADAIDNRADMPVLDARDVTTLISDSGITRYRIKTPSWQVYDKSTPAHWEFPEGIYLEKFSPDLSADAFMEADYAYYNEDDQLWHLVGNVHALNLEGERFDTQELFWSQHDEKVYSDSLITITRATSVISGVGFRSNQEMTKYVILHPTGYFPIED